MGFKLRQLGLTNQIADESDSNRSEFLWQNLSDSESDNEFGLPLKGYTKF